MFEAPGVWDSKSHQSKQDRLNVGRLRDYYHHVKPRWQTGMLKQLVASDVMFRSDPPGAYSTAWAFSFYLCETRPRKYGKYLAKTANREMFTSYAAAERVADFESVFGNEWKMLEVKFLRYMGEM